MANCLSFSSTVSSVSASAPPPPYSFAVSPSSVSYSSANANLGVSLSRQFLSIHSLIVRQEKELNVTRSLLSESPLDASLNQRYQITLMELQSLYARRKQMSVALLQKYSPTNLLQRQKVLQNEVENLHALLYAANQDCDFETAGVLAAQLQRKNTKLRALFQRMASLDAEEIFRCAQIS